MKKTCGTCLLLPVFIVYAFTAGAQYYNQMPYFLKGNSMWTFGRWSGLNFNNYSNGAPSAFRASLVSDEGCASVADRETGSMLFYSNGVSCYNRNNIVMSNGAGLMGIRTGSDGSSGTSTAQGVCIVPFIHDPDKYYLFCLTPEGAYDGTGYLSYSIVDMSLSSGMGGIVPGSKNIMVDSGLSEAMIAIPGNNCDVWLVVHTYDQPVFKAYHITAAGLDPNPVVSAAGNQISGREAYYISQMAVSPARDMIAITSFHYYHDNFDDRGIYHEQPPGMSVNGALVCRFDANTGVVSASIQVAHKKNCYGVIFSPDNTKLYVSIYHNPDASVFAGQIMQYDVGTAFDSAAIATSRQEVQRSVWRSALNSFKLYRDTIYLANQGNTASMHRINNPNAPGAACNYQSAAFRLQSGTYQVFQLNNDVAYPFPADTLYRRFDTLFCGNKGGLSLQAPAGYGYYEWDDFSSRSSRVITEPGVYWVAYRNSCEVYIDTFIARAPDINYHTEERFFCTGGDDIELQVPAGYKHYSWENRDTNAVRNIHNPGIYWVRGVNECHTRTDTFHVAETDVRFSLGVDTVICDATALLLKPRFIDTSSYLWQDGDTASFYIVRESGVYSLVVNKDACTYSDTIHVTYIDVRQDLGNDTSTCKPVSLTLEAQVNPLSRVLWDDGSTGAIRIVRGTGAYSVVVSEDVCSDSAVIMVQEVLCECIVKMPSAFSPNGDGKNDYFLPVVETGCRVNGFIIKIFNRWGQLVYTGTDISSGWDGAYQGQPVTIGTYFYQVQMLTGVDDNPYYQRGDLTLVR